MTAKKAVGKKKPVKIRENPGKAGTLTRKRMTTGTQVPKSKGRAAAKARPKSKVEVPIAVTAIPSAVGNDRGGASKTDVFGSLPPKQQTFVTEYLANGFNATQAAIVAGYAKGSADTQGSRLLVNVKVATVLAERMGKSLAKREITAERVLDEIALMAFSPLRPKVLAGISLFDKGMNLERLGKFLKLFTEKVEHSGGVKVLSDLTDEELEARIKGHGVNGSGPATEDRAAGAAGRAGGKAEAKEDLVVLPGDGPAKA